MSEKTALQTNKNISPTFIPMHNTLLQRKCACGGNPGPSSECAECRQKRMASQQPLIQPKLTMGQPNDKYEQEADSVADAVMRMPDPKIQRQANGEEKEDDDEKVVQTKPISHKITPLVQRQTVDEEKDEDDETVQTMASPNHMPEVTPAVEANINAMKGGGQPLDPATRAYMEPRFGHDFSQVRIHTDAKAAESTQWVNALAYTIGKDVVFGAGQYTPRTMRGKKLLAHELTHVVQQNQSRHLQRHSDPDNFIPGDNYYFNNQGQARMAALARATELGPGHTITHDPSPMNGQPHYHVVSPKGGRIKGHFFYGRRRPRKERGQQVERERANNRETEDQKMRKIKENLIKRGVPVLLVGAVAFLVYAAIVDPEPISKTAFAVAAILGIAVTAAIVLIKDVSHGEIT